MNNYQSGIGDPGNALRSGQLDSEIFGQMRIDGHEGVGVGTTLTRHDDGRLISPALGLALAGTASIAALGLAGAWRMRRAERQRATMMFDARAARAIHRIRPEELESLPLPVQRWMRWAGVPGHERVDTVRLRQTGQMRMAEGSDWLRFRAVQYMTASPPRFLWSAAIMAGPVPVLQATDMFADDGGHMQGVLAGWIPIVSEAGKDYDEAELVRYLADLFTVPTAALEPEVAWGAIDDASARVTITDGECSATAVMLFDPAGRPLGLRARRMHTRHGLPELWSITVTDYQEVDGLRIPSHGQAAWHLETGDFEYARFAINDVQFDVAAAY